MTLARRIRNSWLLYRFSTSSGEQQKHKTTPAIMSSMNFSGGKQYVKPPQRGIFPLDHDAECKPAMDVSFRVEHRIVCVSRSHVFEPSIQKYLDCLNESRDVHYKCRELSKEYLQCRMDKQLMAQEDLNKVSFRGVSTFMKNQRISPQSRWDFRKKPKSKMHKSMTSPRKRLAILQGSI